ncbi:MAG: trypsin-like peptidase domain-containing protein [Candidatus Eisenbacteria bacterium]
MSTASSRARAFAFVFLLLLPAVATADRSITPEAQLFQGLRDGVFTVYGDEGHGSGFLIDPSGLVLTNQHVIANSKYVRVQISDELKVRAHVLEADDQGDIAILRIHPDRVDGLPVMRLADRTDDLAFEGERVIAIGSPLNQTRIVTSGIVSKVDGGVILSDVTVNPGNSGGPLINLDGETIGMLTFRDVDAMGPGVSGSIAITEAKGLIAAAKARAGSGTPPDPGLLPVFPKDGYPLWALERAASRPNIDETPYLLNTRPNDNDIFGGKAAGSQLAIGDYFISFMTPPFIYRTQKEVALEVSKKRKAREAKGGAEQAESFDPFQDLKDWYQHLGEYTPTVLVSVTPKIGETAGSVVGGIVAGAVFGVRAAPEYEFKADLKDVVLKVDGERQEEIQRGMSYGAVTQYGKDLARSGQFVFSPDCFAHRDGRWPVVTIEVYSIDKPTEPMVVRLPQWTLEQIWVDFEPYREQLRFAETESVVGS